MFTGTRPRCLVFASQQRGDRGPQTNETGNEDTTVGPGDRHTRCIRLVTLFFFTLNFFP